MNKIKTIGLLLNLFAFLPLKAQNSPVGIVSVQDTVKGFQFGIISSVAPDGGHGVQFGGVSNTSGQTFNGLQLGGISNITQGMERGLQLSGFLNVSSDMMRGWQFGAVNYADSLDGTQIGFFNVARRRPEGWQVGVINLSYDTIGRKIGLVNVNPKTDIDLMMYGGSSTKGNIAVRYRNKSTYNIIGAGTHFMGLDSKFSGAVFYRLGQYAQLSPKLSLSGDIGYYHVETFSKNNNDKPELEQLSTFSPVYDKWVKYAFVLDGKTVRVYADGVLVHEAKCDWTDDIFYDGAHFTKAMISIGRTQYWGDDPLTGAMDDLRVYSCALTEKEILEEAGIIKTADDAAAVRHQAEKLNIAIDDSSVSLDLPFLLEDGVAIKWTSSDENTITNDGIIIRPSSEKNVILTATLSRGYATVEKKFELTVRPAETVNVSIIDAVALSDVVFEKGSLLLNTKVGLLVFYLL